MVVTTTGVTLLSLPYSKAFVNDIESLVFLTFPRIRGLFLLQKRKCNVEKPLYSSRYERRLQQEIESLNAQIRDLTMERQALERQLVKARQETGGIKDVSRKNSFLRIMIERRVLAALSEKSPLSSKDLMAHAKLVTFDMNQSTFRTHLHRLKLKGEIETAGTRGNWRLSQPKKSKDSPSDDVFG